MVGAVVQKMVPHSSVRELHLAIAYDNVLGPVVEFGAGGIGSELYQDKKAALVPITLSEADRLVESTRIARALGTYRGLRLLTGRSSRRCSADSPCSRP